MFLFSPGPAPPPPKRLIHLPGKQGERSGFRAEGVVGCRAALTAPLKTPLWRAGLRLAPAPAATPPVTRDRGGVLGGRERTRGSSLRSDELPGRVQREPRGDISSQDDPAGCISVVCGQPRAPHSSVPKTIPGAVTSPQHDPCRRPRPPEFSSIRHLQRPALQQKRLRPSELIRLLKNCLSRALDGLETPRPDAALRVPVARASPRAWRGAAGGPTASPRGPDLNYGASRWAQRPVEEQLS